MEIQQHDGEEYGYFSATENGVTAGKMAYEWAGDKIVITHTEVDPAFGGKGVGKQLVMAAVAFAREEELTIIPVCPFARKVLEGDDSFQDVLDQPVP